MDSLIDLHLHTVFSDGTTSPPDLLDAVRSAGLVAFSVTDHDTLGGYWSVQEFMSDDDPELVPGVELSVSLEGHDLHLLAYQFDPSDRELHVTLEAFRERRNLRARMMVQKLNELDVDISFEDVKSAAGAAPIGRPHVADALVDIRAVRSYDEAFRKYIRNGGPAFVSKRNFAPAEAISLVHRAGGVTALAHPAINDAARFIETLVNIGLDGIEVYHPFHSRRDVERFGHLADRFRLLITGGSDFHGRFDSNKFGSVGSQKVPAACLDRLKERAQRRKGTC